MVREAVECQSLALALKVFDKQGEIEQWLLGSSMPGAKTTQSLCKMGLVGEPSAELGPQRAASQRDIDAASYWSE